MKKAETILSELCHLDFDAIAAYEAALDRLDDETAKRTIGEFCNDHREHTKNLNRLLRQRSEEEVTDTDFKKVLTKGKVVIAGLVNDNAIFQAMEMNEKVTTEAYEKALKCDDLTAEERTTLEAHWADEKRHKQWFSDKGD